MGWVVRGFAEVLIFPCCFSPDVFVDIIDVWNGLLWMHICDFAGYMRFVRSLYAFKYLDICAPHPIYLPPPLTSSTPSSTLSHQTLINSSTHTHTEGAIYYSSTSSATYQTGADTTVRGQFVSHGSLDNSQDGNFRAIEDDWCVVGS